MDNFDVFLAYINFSDLPYGKVRPTVVVEVELTEDSVALFPVYSHKRNWSSTDRRSHLIKIVDWEKAGLENSESYIDISEIIEYSKLELSKFKKIGHLSDSDIDKLNTSLEK
jgi:hypothetical protein